MDWAREAYELGLGGPPPSMSHETFRRIMSDQNPTNWVKWWRRGVEDGRRLASFLSAGGGG